MPPTLSRHFAHLFVRDFLVMFNEDVHPKDDSSSAHFEVSIYFCYFRECCLL
jgi:hypothetical protein